MGSKSMGTPFYTDYTNPHGGEMYGLNQTASDERLKDHVSGAKGIESTLDSLHPKSFEYKEPSVDGYGQRTGIMAQDLAKTPLGRQVIEDTPRGMYLDNSKALSLALAANANLNDRLKKLESKGQVDALQPRRAKKKNVPRHEPGHGRGDGCKNGGAPMVLRLRRRKCQWKILTRCRPSRWRQCLPAICIKGAGGHA